MKDGSNFPYKFGKLDARLMILFSEGKITEEAKKQLEASIEEVWQAYQKEGKNNDLPVNE